MTVLSSKENSFRWVFFCVSLFMIAVAVWASLKENLFEVLPSLIREPWVAATLIDFYFNIFILSFWVFYKERSKRTALIWTFLFVTLGSIATAFYVFIQFRKLLPGENAGAVFLKR